MANLTLSIDEKLLQAARIRAVKEGTSVNEVCRQAIEAYARQRGDALSRYRDAQALVDGMPRPRGKAETIGSRDDLYTHLFEERSPAKAAHRTGRANRHG